MTYTCMSFINVDITSTNEKNDNQVFKTVLFSQSILSCSLTIQVFLYEGWRRHVYSAFHIWHHCITGIFWNLFIVWILISVLLTAYLFLLIPRCHKKEQKRRLQPKCHALVKTLSTKQYYLQNRRAISKGNKSAESIGEHLSI